MMLFVFCSLYFISLFGRIIPNVASSLPSIFHSAAFAGDTAVMLCGGSHGIMSSCEIVRVTLGILADFTYRILKFSQFHSKIFGVHVTQGSVAELSNVSVSKNLGEGVVINGVGSFVSCRYCPGLSVRVLYYQFLRGSCFLLDASDAATQELQGAA